MNHFLPECPYMNDWPNNAIFVWLVFKAMALESYCLEIITDAGKKSPLLLQVPLVDLTGPEVILR